MNAGWEAVRRVALIARNTLREAARQKAHYIMLLVALALVAAAHGLRELHFGTSELKFVADCGLGVMALFGAILVISASAQWFVGEVENRTVIALLARPVRRAEFVLGKGVALAALAAVFCALVAGALGTTIWLRESQLAGDAAGFPRGEEAFSVASLAAATLLQWLKLVVLAAFALLVASYARTPWFAVMSMFLVLAICHLQPLVHETYARADSPWTRGGAALVSWIFPNFQLFGIVESLTAADLPAAEDVGRLVLYASVYVGVAGGLAVFSFKRREI